MDSLEGVTYDPATQHQYTYAGNDPVNMVDPTGLFTLVESSIVTSIVSTLATFLTPGFGSIGNKIQAALDDFDKLHTLKLNEKASREELGLSWSNIGQAGAEKLDRDLVKTAKETITRSFYLGDGSVEFAFEASEALAGGGFIPKGIIAVWRHNASLWMGILPEGENVTELRSNPFNPPQNPQRVRITIPGGYLDCGFL